jgi:hypothetical protein
MEMEMREDIGAAVERLAAAATLLEQAAERLAQQQTAFTGSAEASIGRIVATVATSESREAELERKLAAEQTIEQLQARAAASGRKTLPAPAANLLAKHGVALDTLEAGALDAALVSLSLEQRIAVKSQLMRAGLIG